MYIKGDLATLLQRCIYDLELAVTVIQSVKIVLTRRT